MVAAVISEGLEASSCKVDRVSMEDLLTWTGDSCLFGNLKPTLLACHRHYAISGRRVHHALLDLRPWWTRIDEDDRRVLLAFGLVRVPEERKSRGGVGNGRCQPLSIGRTSFGELEGFFGNLELLLERLAWLSCPFPANELLPVAQGYRLH